MEESLSTAIYGTVVLFVVSGVLACAMGLVLAAGSASRRKPLRYAARVAIDLTRGVPTSLMVIAAGLGMLRVAEVGFLPAIYPGTEETFQQLAWGIALALALGSAGHLAEIFRSARDALGRDRLDQAALLGLSPARRSTLIIREAAVIGLAPTGSRLVHHLHNTAFGALFPVTELFGRLQAEASTSFQVAEVAAFGCLLYVALSGVIWIAFRAMEMALTHRFPALPRPVSQGADREVLA